VITNIEAVQMLFMKDWPGCTAEGLKKDILPLFEKCGEQFQISAASHGIYTVERSMGSSVENCDDIGITQPRRARHEQNQLGRLPPSDRQH